MLNIGRITLRNLPEQVGFLTKEVEKIWESLDGLDVYDNVIILDSLDPLSPNQLEIVNKPVAFIVYNNTLYMKRGVGVDEAYFDAVFQVTESLGVISFNSSEITVSYPLGTLTLTNTSASAYNKTEMDTALATKLNSADLLDAVYPVGAIYLSVDSTSPASLFGGTWQAIKDVFLLSAGDVYSNGATGGNANHSHGLTNANARFGSDGTNYFFDNNKTIEWTAYSKKTQPIAGTGSYPVNSAIGLNGNTDSASNMPPYLVVCMWKRVA